MRLYYVFSALCVFWILACCFPSKELEEKRKVEKAAAAASVDAIRLQLKAAAGLIPTAAITETQCPEEALKADLSRRKAANKNGSLLDTPVRVEQGSLLASAGLEGTDTRKNPILKWMSDDTVGRVFEMEGKTGYSRDSEAETLSKRFAEKGTYLWVFRLVQFEPPVVSKEAGIASDAEYEGGRAEAWLILWDLQANAAVCASAFAGKSSKEISYKDEGVMKQTLQEALQDDLSDVLKEEATQARNRMTATLKLGAKLLEL